MHTVARDDKGGTRGATAPRRETLAPPVWEKVTIRRGFLADDSTFTYCTNYEHLLI